MDYILYSSHEEAIKTLLHKKRRILLLAGDLALLTLAFLASVWLRYGTVRDLVLWGLISRTLPLAVLVQAAFLFLNGLYRGMFRYSGLRELIGVVLACFLSLVIVLVALYPLGLLGRPQGMAYYVFIIDFFLAMAFIGGSRTAIRLGYEYLRRRSRFQGASTPGDLKRVIIYGAGDAGEEITREAELKGTAALKIVGFVDDDPQKTYLRIHGKPILGQGKDLPRLVLRHDVQEILIAVPSASGEQMKETVQNCIHAKVPYRTLPGIAEVMDGRVELSQAREVRIEDLLRRNPVETDRKGIGEFLNFKRVMVTGAGGSIGSELCRQIMAHSPMGLILVERNECNLFQIEQELQKTRKGVPLLPILGDVKDFDRMQVLLRETRPHIIFHAAAYKHVPLVECNIRAALENNVLGTKNMADLAAFFGVEAFVLVSTDKAVKPVNAMGATKRACELYLRKLAKGPEGKITRYLTVRFGNVLDSSGSVIPTFREQIAKGGPVTVTHPEMTRFFMTISEACQLILQAAVLGRGGEIFILDMGEPIKILDLARDLITLSRLAPDNYIPITLTGLRPGEKIHEELWNSDESPMPTEHPKILKARISSQADLNGQLDWLSEKIPFITESAAQKLLSSLVQDYNPNTSVPAGLLQEQTQLKSRVGEQLFIRVYPAHEP